MIAMKSINKGYMLGEERLPILKDISFSVDKGEYVAILGPSGSGKTTLMNVMGCMDSLDTGEYYLNGFPIHTMKAEELTQVRNREIGFIFQGFNLIANLNAIENVELPLIYRGIGKSERHRLAKEALAKVGLEKRMRHKPSEMSGGQQQRVAIARAIAAEPPVILADEPTGNLDSASTLEIMEILKGLHQAGRSVILITHDNEIAEQADRVIKIRDGKIVSDTRQNQSVKQKDMEDEKNE